MTALVCAGVMLALRHTPLAEVVLVDLEQKASFHAREALGFSPSLDRRLKIFSFDDATATALGGLDVSLDDWAAMLEALDKSKPRAVVLDKVFDGEHAPDDVRRFVKRMAALKTPITTMASLSREKITLREELALDRASFRMDGLGTGPAAGWLARELRHAYGPRGGMAAGFAAVGHTLYERGRIHPWMRVGSERYIPHGALTAAQQAGVGSDGLMIDGAFVRVDRRGRIVVNFAPSDVYARRAYALLPLLRRAQNNTDVPVVLAGDIVLILGSMASGHVARLETPYGSMPQGYVTAALLNSILTGDWAEPLGGTDKLIVIMAFLGAALGGMRRKRFWAVFGVSALGYVVLALGAFSLTATLVPWAFPVGAFAVSALARHSQVLRGKRLDALKTERDVETSRLVQQGFFPANESQSANLKVSVHFQPAGDLCGGDFWAHFPTGERCDWLLIGDATGTSVPAALVTAMVHATCQALRNLVVEGAAVTPATFLRILNDLLCRTAGSEATMTCLVARLDWEKKQITYANAGHAFPYILKPKRIGTPLAKTNVCLTAAGTILGMDAQATFSEETLTFAPGDKLVLYSDGLVNNAPPGGKGWGRRNLMRLLDRCSELDAKTLRERLADESARHAGPRGRLDDVTVVVAEARLLDAVAEAPAPVEDAKSSVA